MSGWFIKPTEDPHPNPRTAARGSEAIRVAVTEGLKTGAVVGALLAAVHFGGTHFAPAQYKRVPVPLRRIVGAVFLLNGFWIQANMAYADQLLDWRRGDAEDIRQADLDVRRRAEGGGGAARR
jgi:hypothetical protein